MLSYLHNLQGLSPQQPTLGRKYSVRDLANLLLLIRDLCFLNITNSITHSYDQEFKILSLNLV